MKAIRRTKRSEATQRTGSLPPVSVRQTEYRPASYDEIAQRAYEIWQRHGCPAGTEFQDWLAAEAELRSRR